MSIVNNTVGFVLAFSELSDSDLVLQNSRNVLYLVFVLTDKKSKKAI